MNPLKPTGVIHGIATYVIGTIPTTVAIYDIRESTPGTSKNGIIKIGFKTTEDHTLPIHLY